MTIRASLRDVERTLLIADRAGGPGGVRVPAQRARDADPGVAVPVSLLGTFGVMYLLGYSLDNLSLMALTIATGFVVDDAIVVLENITRHIEAGMPRFEAALPGAREVGFTVLSMSLSLVAVFIPILLMGGIVGRLFREFAITLSVAVLISLVVSLTTTPMMCSRFIRHGGPRQTRGGCSALSERALRAACCNFYARAAALGAAQLAALVMVLLAATVVFNVYLYRRDPQGLLPAAGHRPPDRRHPGRPGISFQSMRASCAQFVRIVQARSGGRHRGRLHRRRLGRRRADQQRLHLRLAEGQVGSASCPPTR